MLCSFEAAVISAMRSFTRFTWVTTSVMVWPVLADQARAAFDLVYRVVDQALDFLGGGGRAARQAAHLAGHDGKAPALLACAGCFHGSVQGQNVWSGRQCRR